MPQPSANLVITTVRKLGAGQQELGPSDAFGQAHTARNVVLAGALFSGLFFSGCSHQRQTVFPQTFGRSDRGGTGPTIYYSPTDNLERIDVSLIDQARQTIDMDAYSLADQALTAALVRAAGRGVRVRIYLDREQALEAMRRSADPLEKLARTPHVETRVKGGNLLGTLRNAYRTLIAPKSSALETSAQQLTPFPLG